MKPLQHSEQSIRRYGGNIGDYLEIHEFLDMTKAAHPDMRHRALLHNSMGPYIAVRVFGRVITNNDGYRVDVRQICEDHIIEDLGRIPTVSDFLELIPEEHMNKFAYTSNKTKRVD